MTKIEEFLRKKRVWTRFKKNYDPKISIAAKRGYKLEDMLKGQENSINALYRFFTWAETPEGSGFWHKLAYEYNKSIGESNE